MSCWVSPAAALLSSRDDDPASKVCDGDTAEWFATADKRIALVLTVFVNFVVERIGCIYVGVCPAVDRDGLDVCSWIETSLRQAASELAANVALDGFVRGGIQFVASGSLLFAGRQPGIRSMRKTYHVNDGGFVRVSGVAVAPEEIGRASCRERV